MRITVKLLATYRSRLPEQARGEAGFGLDVPEGTRVADILAELPIRQCEPYTFFVNGRHAERDQVLEDQDLVAVFPAAGGG